MNQGIRPPHGGMPRPRRDPSHMPDRPLYGPPPFADDSLPGNSNARAPGHQAERLREAMAAEAARLDPRGKHFEEVVN